MKLTMTVSATFHVDPEKVKEVLDTEGLLAGEAQKVIKDRVWRELDEHYSEYGRWGDYTREIRDDMREVLEGLDILEDRTDPGKVQSSRPVDGGGQ